MGRDGNTSQGGARGEGNLTQRRLIAGRTMAKKQTFGTYRASDCASSCEYLTNAGKNRSLVLCSNPSSDRWSVALYCLLYHPATPPATVSGTLLTGTLTVRCEDRKLRFNTYFKINVWKKLSTKFYIEFARSFSVLSHLLYLNTCIFIRLKNSIVISNMKN